jgi:hypothetical protein
MHRLSLLTEPSLRFFLKPLHRVLPFTASMLLSFQRSLNFSSAVTKPLSSAGTSITLARTEAERWHGGSAHRSACFGLIEGQRSLSLNIRQTSQFSIEHDQRGLSSTVPVYASALRSRPLSGL